MRKIVLTFMILCLAGCLNQSIPNVIEKFPKTIHDDMGREIKIQGKPQRIISLAPSITEILFAVGLGESVIGVDEYSNYPEEAKAKMRVGSYLAPNMEILISLHPDLVFVSDITSKEDVGALEEKGLVVVVLAPQTMGGIMKDIRLVGAICGKSAEADNLAGSLEERIGAITEKIGKNAVNGPRVYMEYYPYWTYGPGSFGNDLIAMAGGTNIGAKTANAYSEISNEFVVSSNPEIIIFTVGSHATTTKEEIRSRTGWNGIDAVRNDKIYTIDDDLISRPGPRIVDALEYLAKILHPDIFPQFIGKKPITVISLMVKK